MTVVCERGRGNDIVNGQNGEVSLSLLLQFTPACPLDEVDVNLIRLQSCSLLREQHGNSFSPYDDVPFALVVDT